MCTGTGLASTACAVLEFPVSSYYHAKKREAEPTVRELRDAVMKEKVMEVWKDRRKAGKCTVRGKSGWH